MVPVITLYQENTRKACFILTISMTVRPVPINHWKEIKSRLVFPATGFKVWINIFKVIAALAPQTPSTTDHCTNHKSSNCNEYADFLGLILLINSSNFDFYAFLRNCINENKF